MKKYIDPIVEVIIIEENVLAGDEMEGPASGGGAGQIPI